MKCQTRRANLWTRGLTVPDSVVVFKRKCCFTTVTNYKTTEKAFNPQFKHATKKTSKSKKNLGRWSQQHLWCVQSAFLKITSTSHTARCISTGQFVFPPAEKFRSIRCHSNTRQSINDQHTLILTTVFSCKGWTNAMDAMGQRQTLLQLFINGAQQLVHFQS